MGNPIRLKSKLLREGDPYKVDISQFMIPLTVDQRIYERDLLNFLRKYATVEEAAEVAPQDMVTLTCSAESPRFCKEHITIRIGLGLFSKELENQLVGWKAGQSGTVTVKEQHVNVTVEAIKHEQLPEVDDALAQRCGIEYIKTAQEVHTYCKGKQFDDILEMPLDDAFPYLMRLVLEDSQFELDSDELQFSRELSANQFLQSSLFAERSFEDFTDEEFLETFGISKNEMLSNMMNGGEYTLKCALLGQTLLERTGKLPTEDDYKAYLRRYTDISDMTEEQAAQAHSVTEYLLDYVAGYFMDEIEALTLRRLKECIK